MDIYKTNRKFNVASVIQRYQLQVKLQNGKTLSNIFYHEQFARLVDLTYTSIILS